MGKTSEAEGHRAEERAAEYLQSKGLKLLEKRYRCRLGEIDLILEEEGMIVFCEVKYRSSLTYGTPEESVSAEKQRKLRLCARHYLCEKGTEDLSCRFDVLSMWKQGERLKVRWIRNAF